MIGRFGPNGAPRGLANYQMPLTANCSDIKAKTYFDAAMLLKMIKVAYLGYGVVLPKQLRARSEWSHPKT